MLGSVDYSTINCKPQDRIAFFKFYNDNDYYYYYIQFTLSVYFTLSQREMPDIQNGKWLFKGPWDGHYLRKHQSWQVFFSMGRFVFLLTFLFYRGTVQTVGQRTWKFIPDINIWSNSTFRISGITIRVQLIYLNDDLQLVLCHYDKNNFNLETNTHEHAIFNSYSEDIFTL